MTTTTIVTPECLKELAAASWYDVGSPDDDHKLERADLPQQPGFFFIRKKRNRDQIYMVKAANKNHWTCTKCATTVLAALVAHSIHDGPFPLSGSGQCSNETVPYCPTCEKEPDFHGSIIRG
jgi:hypothetical protein